MNDSPIRLSGSLRPDNAAPPSMARQPLPVKVPSWRLQALRCLCGLLLGCSALVLGPAPAFAGTDYELAPGDVVEFDILDDDNLPIKLTIGSDGQIAVPFIGGVTVAGMPVAAAMQVLRTRFKEQRFLNDAKLSLSVTTFRPIYVLGDVKTPGSYPFMARLTVEQAVGLAGGPATAIGTLESNLLTGAKLRSELAGIETDIVQEGITYARLRAQIDERNSVQLEDVPYGARPFVRSFDALKKGADDILASEAAAFKTQKSLIQESLQEITAQLGVLDDLVTNQKKTIQFSQDDQTRTGTLLKSGLTRASEMSRVERQLTADQGRLLAIVSQMSDLRRSQVAQKRDMAQLEDQRKKDALTQLQQQDIKIGKLLEQRKAAEDQLLLTTNFAAQALRENTQILEYSIHRRADDGVKDVTVTSLSDVLPGDVVLVKVRKPEPSGVADQAAERPKTPG